MKIVKGDTILDVTDKAYEVIYKARGFIPYIEEKKQPKRKDKAGDASCS